MIDGWTGPRWSELRAIRLAVPLVALIDYRFQPAYASSLARMIDSINTPGRPLTLPRADPPVMTRHTTDWTDVPHSISESDVLHTWCTRSLCWAPPRRSRFHQ